MEELRFRKMICNAGHESRPFAEGEMLPRRCPVCNQPYDRRFNRPVLCYEDGSVPGSADETTGDTGSNSESGSEYEGGRPAYSQPEEPPVYGGEPTGRGRGRGMDSTRGGGNSYGTGYPTGPARGRGRIVASEAQAGSTGYASGRQQGYQAPYGAEADSGIGLYTGGDCIRIPAEGCYLGREEYGQEVLGINPLISRKHAYIKVNHFGKVQLRDEGSLNGTFADDGNGRRKLKPHETVELKPGDTIWLANHLLAVEKIKR